MSKNADLSKLVSTNANISLQLNSLTIANSTANTWVFSSNGTMLVGGTPVINSTGLVGGGFTNGSSIAVTNLDVTNSGVITVGNSTVNATANSTGIKLANATTNTVFTSSGFDARIVGSNIRTNIFQGTGYFYGASGTGDLTTITYPDITIGNMGTSQYFIANNSLITLYRGSNSFTVNTTSLSIGNSSVNSSLNATSLAFNGGGGSGIEINTSSGNAYLYYNILNLASNTANVWVGSESQRVIISPSSISIGNMTSNAVVINTTASIFTKLLVGNTSNAPANSSDEGIEGEIRIDSSYVYICTSANTWKRVAISTW